LATHFKKYEHIAFTYESKINSSLHLSFKQIHVVFSQLHVTLTTRQTYVKVTLVAHNGLQIAIICAIDKEVTFKI